MANDAVQSFAERNVYTQFYCQNIDEKRTQRIRSSFVKLTVNVFRRLDRWSIQSLGSRYYHDDWWSFEFILENSLTIVSEGGYPKNQTDLHNPQPIFECLSRSCFQTRGYPGSMQDDVMTLLKSLMFGYIGPHLRV